MPDSVKCLADVICITDIMASTVANIVIACFTAALFTLQYWKNRHDSKVAGANFKLALYDKRMDLYLRIEAFLQDFVGNGRPSLEKSAALRYDLRLAHFLFPKEALDFPKLMHERAFEWKQNELIWEPIRKRSWDGDQTITEEERIAADKALKVMHEIEGWFLEQVEEEKLPNVFAPYLALPETP